MDQVFAGQRKRFAGKKVNQLKASLGAEIDGASGMDMKAFSDTLAQGKLDVLNQFGSDEALVEENIDSLSGLVATKTGKSKGTKKSLEEILPGLIRK
jgi:hypothetical protein